MRLKSARVSFFAALVFSTLTLNAVAQAQDFCRVIDFEGLAAGTILSNQIPGLEASVAANKGPDALLIFDTSNPTGGDFDLGTPNEAFGGPGIGPGIGNNRSVGNVVIIAEDVVDTDANGLVDDPDDDLHGGVFRFDFESPVLVRRFTLVDFEEAGGTIDGIIRGMSNGTAVFSVPIATPGDNSLQDINLNQAEAVDRLEVVFPSSGGIGEFEVCCDGSLDSDSDGVPDCVDLCPGADDALLESSCDGDDSDSCATGTLSCGEQGELICSDNSDIDDADNDGVSDCEELCDGANDALLGTACDGDDSDSCQSGVFVCAEGGMLSCSDGPELDDSDGDSIADCEDTCIGNDSLIDASCDGSDTDECEGGVFTCESGTLICTDTPESADADNDGIADCEDACGAGDDSLIGTSCDGADSDSCASGVFVCNESGALSCTDMPALDDADADLVPDCDDVCAVGDDRLLGTSCDGEDSDSCASGMYSCTLEGMLSCSDDPAVDDADADGNPDCTDDCVGDESTNGQQCDGVDADACQSGALECSSGTLLCSDGAAFDDSDKDGTADCEDLCPSDMQKQAPGLCGCGVAEIDTDGDDIPDCLECVGKCDTINDPTLDEDQDGTSNCQELDAGTDPCDAGSFTQSTPNFACVGANFFLSQVNIATIKNTSPEENLDASVIYFDASGVERGRVTYWIMPDGRQDSIINDLGAEADSYGTVCVQAHTSRENAWTGGLITYKPRLSAAGAPELDSLGEIVYDFALQYSFAEASTGSALVSLNTNVLGSASLAANWIRIFDGVPGDEQGVQGVLTLFDIGGVKISELDISLPDGGRTDIAAHELLGKDAVGAAEFVAASPEVKFQLETSRYFYETNSANFLTAFTIPLPPLSGAERVGYLSSREQDLSIVETINGLPSSVQTQVRISREGLFAANDVRTFSARTSAHFVYGNDILPASTQSAARIFANKPESVSAISLVYNFSSAGELAYGAAFPFLNPGPQLQRTEFNTYLNQSNTLVSFNSSEKSIKAEIRIFDLMGKQLSTRDIEIPENTVILTPLEDLPAQSYGSIEILADASGLVVRNQVRRGEQYELSFPAN